MAVMAVIFLWHIEDVAAARLNLARIAARVDTDEK